jgi:hypothetical protein
MIGAYPPRAPNPRIGACLSRFWQATGVHLTEPLCSDWVNAVKVIGVPFWGAQGEAAGRPFPLAGRPLGPQNGAVDVLGGFLAVWDRAWLVLVMGMGLVMAYVLHRGRPPDEK